MLVVLKNWTKRHRGDIYGIGGLIGLLITVVAIPKSCTSPPPTPPKENVIRKIQAGRTTHDKRTITEQSAGQITDTSRDLPNIYSSEKRLEDLFLDRWIDSEGWVGVVFDHPRKLFEDNWQFSVWEDHTGERFSIESDNDEVANLREGYRVHITEGRIARISRSWDGDAYITIDSVSLKILEPISGFQQWWRQFGPSFKASLMSPWMWWVYWWWAMMILFWAPSWIASFKLRRSIRRLTNH